MKHYKDPNTNELFAYTADGSQDDYIQDGLVAITNEEADSIRASKVQAEFDSLTYSEKRASEYPPIADYLDCIVKGDQTQIDTYISKCLAVKAKYPKPVQGV